MCLHYVNSAGRFIDTIYGFIYNFRLFRKYVFRKKLKHIIPTTIDNDFWDNEIFFADLEVVVNGKYLFAR